MERRKIKDICCIGAGYVGGPTCAVIANQNPQLRVTVVDLDEARIARWKSSALPIFENHLQDVVETARDGTDGRTPNLMFSTDISTAVDRADLIFIAVNTPTKVNGVGAGSASDITYVESAARMIASFAKTPKIVVEKSTVPCGTAERLRSIFTALAPEVTIDILSNPEFLAEGSAIENLLNPDRVLIGSQSDERSRDAADALAEVYSWVPRERVVSVNLWSSELAKLAANCMLAQRISSINSLSAICEATGADISELSHSVGLDQRIGKQMLKASAGFGGSCFKKDVLSLVYIARSLHLYKVANYWESVVEINEDQKDRFTQRIISALHGTLTHKKVAILGWAYKKDTGDTRESAAITIALQLLAEGAMISVYDPKVSQQQIYKDLEATLPAPASRVSVCDDAVVSCIDACAIVVLTDWDEFKTDELSQMHANRTPGDFQLGNDKVHSNSRADGGYTATSSDSGIDLAEEPSIVGTEVVTTDDSKSSSRTRIDWHNIAGVVRRPRLIFDGRNILHPAALVSLGFQVESIGRASVF